MAYVSDFDSKMGDSGNVESLQFDEVKLSNGRLRINKGINKVIDGGRTGLNFVGSLVGAISATVLIHEVSETVFSMAVHNWTLLDNLGNIGLAALAGFVASKTVPILVRNVPFIGNKIADFKEDLADDRAARRAVCEENLEAFKRGK